MTRNFDHSRILAARLFAIGLLLAGAGNALADVHYVDLNSTNATPPYTNWITAATNIQDAVDVAVAGDEVIVTNGTYATGGRNGNRVEVDKPLSVRSVNGPQSTTIRSLGFGSIRCVYLTNGANLSGFTLWRGHTDIGGGAYGGTLNNCIVTSNSAAGLNSSPGGGAAHCTLNNCTLSWNSAYQYGGGAYFCTLNNCTLVYNCAACGQAGFGSYSGGAYFCTLNNCIVYYNTASFGYEDEYDSQSTLNYCCTGWSPGGAGCITNEPVFMDAASGELRLQSSSPCINAGNNSYLTNCFDLDRNPRIAGGTVDIGAYEFQSPVSQISYAWLQQFGLPINSSTDTADPDGDAVENYHEWLAGTDPTNSRSSPAQLTITPSGLPPSAIILTWSTNAVGFALQSTTNLLSPAAWVSNSPASVVINGQNAVTNPISGVQKFYRLSH